MEVMMLGRADSEVRGVYSQESAEIGRRIRQAREEKEILQSDLGKEIGKSGQMVGHWESGYARIPAVELKKIAKALGVSVSYLVGEREEPLEGEMAMWLGRLGSRIAQMHDPRLQEIAKESLRRNAIDMERLFLEALTLAERPKE